MKMKATIEIEYEAEDGFQSPRHMLKLALNRAERGLKDNIEEGKPGTVRTGIKRNSTKIEMRSKIIE
jgi:hypothetical protein